MNITEQPNPNTSEIGRLPTLEALTIINSEDHKVAGAVAAVLPAIARAVDGIVERLSRGGRLIYIGAGTSGRLGILDASECPPTFGVPPEMVQGIIAGGYQACYQAVEASEDDSGAGVRDIRERQVTANDVVAGLAASGRTPYVIGAVEYARSVGALTLCITCNEGTELAGAVDIAIEPVVGPEVIAGSTRLKSGTAQKLILNMLSTMTMVRLGYVKGNRMSNLQSRNVKLRERAVGILQEECSVDAETASATLVAADWKLPVALVMQRADVTRAVAEEALAKANQLVDQAVTALIATQ